MNLTITDSMILLGYPLELVAEAGERSDFTNLLRDVNYEPDALSYPPDWPKCPSCGTPALDGHITCGRVECDEGGYRA